MELGFHSIRSYHGNRVKEEARLWWFWRLQQHAAFTAFVVFGVVDVVAVGGDDDLLRSVTYFPV